MSADKLKEIAERYLAYIDDSGQVTEDMVRYHLSHAIRESYTLGLSQSSNTKALEVLRELKSEVGEWYKTCARDEEPILDEVALLIEAKINLLNNKEKENGNYNIHP